MGIKPLSNLNNYKYSSAYFIIDFGYKKEVKIISTNDNSKQPIKE